MLLPMLDQGDYPLLPYKGAKLLVDNSAWKNPQKEYAAAVLVTACATHGEWAPISATAFGLAANDHPQSHKLGSYLMRSVWDLAGEGFIRIEKFAEVNYIIPTAKFGHVLKLAKITDIH